ncbi:hypothetical protein ACB092_12G110100, partial [Castanea dentata]
LVGVRVAWDVPWCCLGDFNVICFPSEKFDGRSFSQTMLKFSEFIGDMHLIDLPFEGGPYTWTSGSNSPLMSRIDRALVSMDWEEQFPNVIQQVLSHPISDHSPILLEARGMERGKSPFRFENMWLKIEGIVEKV